MLWNLAKLMLNISYIFWKKCINSQLPTQWIYKNWVVGRRSMSWTWVKLSYLHLNLNELVQNWLILVHNWILLCNCFLLRITNLDLFGNKLSQRWIMVSRDESWSRSACTSLVNSPNNLTTRFTVKADWMCWLCKTLLAWIIICISFLVKFRNLLVLSVKNLAASNVQS